MNIIIPDQSQRDTALNPTKSFIVEAPAGSGKTELLTRRFLILLGEAVQKPEEILAITFTRKAANEMRLRIIAALKNPSGALTKLSQKVLQRDKQLDWHLLENPNRLRIQTIDAFCTHLTTRMPISSHFGTPPNIHNNPKELYEEAIENLFETIDQEQSYTPALKKLLFHLDNKISTLKTLLINMLAKRDQWLSHLLHDHHEDYLKKLLESSLRHINEEAIQKLSQTTPRDHIENILKLIKFSTANLEQENINSPIVYCKNMTAHQLLESNVHQKELWLGLKTLLLTKENQWRKKPDKKTGFPSPSSIKDKAQQTTAKEMKENMTALLADLENYPAFQQALCDLDYLPPIQYNLNQWEILIALIELLPISAAYLKLIFQKTGQVDFIEITQAALTALGTLDTPSELALALDYQIQHLLIDEFQDTSITHFRLFEKLIENWIPDDGKTIFMVGDPMQSIYRFREAEVGLFLKAKQDGIANIKPTFLSLTVNFRSDKNIVEYNNKIFQEIFPKRDDIYTGAVSYQEAIPFHAQPEKEQAIHIHPLINHSLKQEAEHIVSLIKTSQAKHPNQTIAVLVRARTHLKDLLPTLNAHDLSYQAIELENLASQPVIQDLLALTKALLHPADRIAWLSILRAPWCGLTLKDLHQLTNQNAKTTLWENMNNPEIFHTLSIDAQKRLTPLLEIFTNALANRFRQPLRNWIKDTWLALKGPACLDHESSLKDAEVFFDLLDACETSGDIKHFQQLENRIKELFAAPNTAASEQLQIMTIHKAKGLEFDTVIIPNLQATSPPQDQQLLLWTERPGLKQTPDLILAPIKAADSEQDEIYRYLSYENKLKDEYEEIRLLYVAMTRAKKSLHLIGNSNLTENLELKKPTHRSFLKLLWPHVQTYFIEKLAHTKTDLLQNETTIKKIQSIKRFVVDKKTSVPFQLQSTTLPPINNIMEDKKYSLYQTQVGTLVHRLLNQISQEGIKNWQAKNKNTNTLYRNMLIQLGVPNPYLEKAIEQTHLAIQNTLADKRGQWILTSHKHARSEYPLSANQNKKFIRIIIDRTFIDENNQRWIIDYKTTETNIQKEFYQAQLEKYGYIISQLFPEKIRYGIYFPMLPEWIEWD